MLTHSRLHHRVVAVAALTPPIATVASVVFGIRHTTNHSRQLDIIRAHPLRFTAMLGFEHLVWVSIMVLAVGLVGLVGPHGRILAYLGAAAAVVGSAAAQVDFGPMLVPLSRLSDRTAALYAVNHVGITYGVFQAISPLVIIGLLLAFGAARRARVVPVWCLPVLLVGLVLVSAGGDPIRLLASAVLELPLARLALAVTRTEAPAVPAAV